MLRPLALAVLLLSLTPTTTPLAWSQSAAGSTACSVPRLGEARERLSFVSRRIRQIKTNRSMVAETRRLRAEENQLRTEITRIRRACRVAHVPITGGSGRPRSTTAPATAVSADATVPSPSPTDAAASSATPPAPAAANATTCADWLNTVRGRVNGFSCRGIMAETIRTVRPVDASGAIATLTDAEVESRIGALSREGPDRAEDFEDYRTTFAERAALEQALARERRRFTEGEEPPSSYFRALDDLQDNTNMLSSSLRILRGFAPEAPMSTMPAPNAIDYWDCNRGSTSNVAHSTSPARIAELERSMEPQALSQSAVRVVMERWNYTIASTFPGYRTHVSGGSSGGYYVETSVSSVTGCPSAVTLSPGGGDAAFLREALWRLTEIFPHCNWSPRATSGTSRGSTTSTDVVIQGRLAPEVATRMRNRFTRILGGRGPLPRPLLDILDGRELYRDEMQELTALVNDNPELYAEEVSAEITTRRGRIREALAQERRGSDRPCTLSILDRQFCESYHFGTPPGWSIVRTGTTPDMTLNCDGTELRGVPWPTTTSETDLDRALFLGFGNEEEQNASVAGCTAWFRGLSGAALAEAMGRVSAPPTPEVAEGESAAD